LTFLDSIGYETKSFFFSRLYFFVASITSARNIIIEGITKIKFDEIVGTVTQKRIKRKPP